MTTHVPPTISQFSQPGDLRVGGGALAQLPDVLKRLGLCRPLVVTDRFLLDTGPARRVMTILEAQGMTPRLFHETVPDPTTDSLKAAVAAAGEHGCDAVIGLGGGSPMDTAKAVALLVAQGGAMADYKAPVRNDGPALPIIAVPTTAGSGSEATQFTIITDSVSQEKMLCAGRSFLPAAAIVDYELTLSMPARLTADTGIDALTHAIEAYVSKKATPLTDGLCLTAISSIGRHLRRVHADGSDAEARAAMMVAATQAGIAFSNSSVALVHGMSRPIGAHFQVAHGLSNAMLLVAVTEFSISAATARYADCARALGLADSGHDDGAAARRLVAGLTDLCRDLGVPTPREYGIDHEAWHRLIPVMARQALASGSPANNPRVPSAEDIERLYTSIYC
ncbi:iron-containing alcohol dehydrogenase [Streptomyces hygroscopicus]|nr:iron-containing alcohol dehydrogenase [Streptomyces hygroscopicus]GLV74411.1 alcohol dehydrogenase [Streptomyces hygroscopicus subsp. hygroscopicus]